MNHIFEKHEIRAATAALFLYFREKVKLTQKQATDAIGTHYSRYLRIEAGQMVPVTLEVNRFCKAYDIITTNYYLILTDTIQIFRAKGIFAMMNEVENLNKKIDKLKKDAYLEVTNKLNGS